MKKVLYITSFVVVLLVSFLGITYSYEYKDTESLVFDLIGPSTLYLDINSEYEEYGIKVVNNGIDISNYVKIDSSSVKMNEIGEYKVRYELLVDGNIEYVYRIVKVIDISRPKIKLKGQDIVYIELGNSYIEEGYEVIDNYDKDLNKKVIVTNNIELSKEGEYRVEYKVVDDNGNESKVTRKVIIRKSEAVLE